MIHKSATKLTFAEPLLVKIIIMRQDKTELLEVQPNALLLPGDTLTWSYPPEGLEFTLD